MNTVQIIKDRLSIKDVISKYIKLEKKGNRYVGLCPFHGEKTPSFSVSENDDFYHCFGCKKSGDAFNFVMEIEKKDFPEVLKQFADQLGIALPQRIEHEHSAAKSIGEVLQLAKEWFRQNLAQLKYKGARDYLHDRTISDETISFFELGFAPDSKTMLSDYLKKQAIKNTDILDAGISIQDEDRGNLIDRFRNRIIFPIYNDKKHIIGFGGRIMDGSQPKYLNSPETEIFKKKETLYNLSAAKDSIRKNNEVFVVEGYMDVITMHQAGFTNVVATLGTALTSHHLGKLWKYINIPTICLDGDMAGITASYRSALLSLEYISEGKSLNFVLLPEGSDPDDIIRSKGSDALAKILSNKIDLSELIWNFELSKLEKRTPEAIALFEKNILMLANKIHNNSVRTYYIKYFKDKIWNEFRVGNKVGNKNKTKVTNAHYNISDPESIQQENFIISIIINHPALIGDPVIYNEFMNLHFKNDNTAQTREAILDFVSHQDDVLSLTKLELVEFFKIRNIEYVILDLNFGSSQQDYANIWNVTIKKYLVNDIEKEYKRLILRQDEESFKKARILRDEIISLNKDIIDLQSEIDNEEFLA